MKRRWFAVLGGFIFVLELGLLAVFGLDALDGVHAVSLLLPVFAGVLFVLGGVGARRSTVDWYQFVGAADVLMGIWMGVEFQLLALREGSGGREATIVLAATGVVVGLSMVFIGAVWMQGGRYFDLSTYEEGPILASVGGDRVSARLDTSPCTSVRLVSARPRGSHQHVHFVAVFAERVPTRRRFIEGSRGAAVQGFRPTA